VLAAARLAAIPYFIQEQNTVPGVVNRFFAKGARHIFAGLPMAVGKGLRGKVSITGTPVRPISRVAEDFPYPPGFDKNKKTILICGGSQGALSMNACLLGPAQHWAETGCQVVWQTGKAAFDEVAGKTASLKSMFVFAAIEDLYPYYAVARVVVGRSGASTLAEIAYFGLPCVLIPLPWATENHQWINAGVVQTQGWGIRIKQDDAAGAAVAEAVGRILSDRNEFERMSMRALDHSPAAAVSLIVKTMMDECIP
jgi:UDP-N-acetylglucosamine--N-acetylmuramyl-(pentapeptide) pyrophosphoryl-undecaprenol N-acetylglucosamine transferase